jgi:membrane protein
MRQLARLCWSHAPRWLRTPIRLVIKTFRLYIDDGCGTYAAAISYYAIFSMVPLGIIVLSVLGLAVDREDIVDFVFDQVPLDQSLTVQEDVREIVKRAQQISVAGLSFGLIILAWSGTGIFTAVRKGLNAASHRQRPIPYWRGKLLDFALIPALGLLILLSLALTTVAQIAVEQANALGPLDVNTNLSVRVSSYILPALFSFAMFTLLYRTVPSVPPQWREALEGASFATILFELAKHAYAFAFVLLPFSTDTAIYAGLSTALAFLFWMFINASILLLGAEFARAIAVIRRESRWRAREEASPAAFPLTTHSVQPGNEP